MLTLSRNVDECKHLAVGAPTYYYFMRPRATPVHKEQIDRMKFIRPARSVLKEQTDRMKYKFPCATL